MAYCYFINHIVFDWSGKRDSIGLVFQIATQ